MNVRLNGSRILVTRPGAQGIELCTQIEAEGGMPIAFPSIEIQAIPGLEPEQLIKDLLWSSHVIFISRNAVDFCFKLAAGLKEILTEKKVFATGAGTSKALHDYGVDDVVQPSAESGSEGLLADPELSNSYIQGKHVLIVRGTGGRKILKETLRSRNAVVKYADVYTRQLPNIPVERSESIWQQKIPDIIVVTSVEGLKNLIELTPQKFRSRLFSRKLVVMSQRIASHAMDLGFTISPEVAKEQSNHGLMLAIRNSLENVNEH
jgi:uroporphyrinogen-III synthase